MCVCEREGRGDGVRENKEGRVTERGEKKSHQGVQLLSSIFSETHFVHMHAQKRKTEKSLLGNINEKEKKIYCNISFSI